MENSSELVPVNRVHWSKWLAPPVTGLARGLSTLPFQSANGARVRNDLGLEHWSAISDGKHNLTTDMILWRGNFYLVHASSPWHIASHESKIVLWRSADALTWKPIAEFRMPGGDIRDPKLAVIHDRLFLYVLRNVGFVAEPSATAFTVSDDGVTWTPLEDCTPKGWLFWRPKTQDGKTWYVPAYWNQHGKSVLLKSTDGRSWTVVSQIHEGDHNDETDFEFMDDGRLLATRAA